MLLYQNECFVLSRCIDVFVAKTDVEKKKAGYFLFSASVSERLFSCSDVRGHVRVGYLFIEVSVGGAI